MALAFAEITAFYSVTGPDGADVDRNPDRYPIPELTVTFTPPKDTVVTTENPKGEVLIEPQVGTTNDDGILCSLDGATQEMLPGVFLPVLPDGVAYTVTVTSDFWPAQEYQLVVSEGQQLDLSDRVVVPTNPGSELPQWQSILVQVLAAKTTVLEAATAAIIAAGSVPTPAAITAEINAKAAAERIVQSATFVARWAPNTTYLAGAKVVSPAGDTVTAKVDFTSGAAYVASNWNLPPTFAPKSGGFNFSGPFTSLLNETTGEGFVIKPPTDSRPAVFGWQHASPAGYVFHFESRAGSAAPAAFIGIGLDTAAPDGTLGMSGILIANKVRAQGIVLRNHETITHGDAFGFYGAQDSAVAALVSLHARRANSTTLLELVADVANTATGKLAVFKTAGNHLAGDIDAATGTLRWIDPVDVRALTVRRDITLNNDTGSGSYAKLAVTSTAANPAILELTADQANGSNAHLAYYRPTGGGTYWASRLVATGQNLELQASPAVAKGSETFTAVIGIRNNSVGFFGTAPITKRVTTPDATDLATALTLVNALKADLIAYGLKA
jgi:hypothetical protein